MLPGSLAVLSALITLLLAFGDQFDAVPYGLAACSLTSLWAFVDADRSVKRINKQLRDLE